VPLASKSQLRSVLLATIQNTQVSWIPGHRIVEFLKHLGEHLFLLFGQVDEPNAET
jgi:hypothetical protein